MPGPTYHFPGELDKFRKFSEISQILGGSGVFGHRVLFVSFELPRDLSGESTSTELSTGMWWARIVLVFRSTPMGLGVG